MRRRTILSFTVIPLSGLLMGGCGATQQQAQVAGVVKVCGAPLLGEKYSCTLQSGSVSVVGARGRLVAHQRLRHGRYSFRLPPGTYKLVERNSANRLTRTAKAHSGRTTVVNFVIEAS